MLVGNELSSSKYEELLGILIDHKLKLSFKYCSKG